MSDKSKILGFDIGITSIGWAYVEGEELIDCGVRIFTKAENPKTKESLALPRREARGVRRRLARRKGRLNAIKQLICKEFGLNYQDYIAQDGELPKAYAGKLINPYELRSKALREKLEKEELARVILHIAKHRGYGNKHAKETDDAESGKIKKAISNNEKILNEKGYQSAGEYLYQEFFQKERLQEEKKGNNTTKEFKNVRNKAGDYEHCIAQTQMQNELRLIFEKQREFGLNFSEEFKKKVLETAFFQRPLKDFSDKIGDCTFIEGAKRAPKDSLSAIEFVALGRIINTLKNLQNTSGEVYSRDKINEILQIVLDKGEISYKKLREILDIESSVRFKDSKLDYTKELKEAEKTKLFESKNLQKFKKALGSFEGISREILDSIAKEIMITKDKEKLAKELKKFPLDETQIQNLSNLSFSQTINLSLEALSQILPFMRGEREDKCLRYDEAVEKAGLKEVAKNKSKDDFLPPLENYEPYLANPVVARALSEYRKVLNALLRKYGKMHKIHIEFTREVGKSKEERNKIEKEQKENFAKNQEAQKQCEILGLPINGANILKMKLWREQQESCVYSGKEIAIDDLKNPAILQVDHIYPYSRSFDDSYNNKVLVFSKENQNKLNKTPFEAFGENKDKWEKILSLASKLPKPKRQRIYNMQFKDKEQGFLTRNINDTGYIARLVSQWTKNCLSFEKLSEDEVSIAGEKGSKVHVEVISGSLTAMLRHYWGLGDKNRDNHLHHAVDAIIIAYSNEKVIKAFSDYKKHREQNKAKFYAKEIAESEYKKQKVFFEPTNHFRQKVLEKIDSIFVSKPPRKRARGALHEETFYSFERLCNDKEYAKKEKMDYGGKAGIQKAIALGKIRQVGTKIVSNGTMVRVDIFQHKSNGKFYGVPIYTMDFALGVLPNKAVVSGKDKQGVIKDWLEMDSNYEFCFSLFKDDLILVQKKEMEKAELCYYTDFNSNTAGIKFEKHNNLYVNLNENERKLFTSKEVVKGGKKNVWKDKTPKEIEQLEKNRKIIGGFVTIEDLKTFEKYQVSPLGEVQKADFAPRQAITLKSSPKHRINK
ncbi:type II CRISPR RNA-guided endonuclease Cas9 [Helicobacter sp. MIT 11-5569]|uniref:type II CRISPR RNA-guided endonuclease Cas9 n=1 Tax=Helicobacter sp. MIT 11-5569 TaxID=1548151 RepID=UPI00051FACE0|nr:type II CRISPR RNA-guided endonuclease Cas9 [Helicobacter sp. MIT 11-5569]TLD85073.1 type II CRISPR RNA-guided endonuclease Cas9 [Helicobacter sp. MIT 11-5569]